MSIAAVTIGGLSDRAANALLDKSIKYGYQTWRAVAWLAVLYLTFFGTAF